MHFCLAIAGAENRSAARPEITLAIVNGICELRSDMNRNSNQNKYLGRNDLNAFLRCRTQSHTSFAEADSFLTTCLRKTHA
jgi:hypothetical protein